MNAGLLQALGQIDQGEMNPLAMIAGLFNMQQGQEDMSMKRAQQDAMLPLQMALTQKQISEFDNQNKNARAALMLQAQKQADEARLAQEDINSKRSYYQGITNNQEVNNRQQMEAIKVQAEQAGLAALLKTAELYAGYGMNQDQAMRNPGLAALTQRQGLDTTNPVQTALAPLMQAKSYAEIIQALQAIQQTQGINPQSYQQPQAPPTSRVNALPLGY